jgi:hypothetical protein
MSETHANDPLARLKLITTEIAWRQWAAIGGSAAAENNWTSAVDPEALILASLYLWQHEPRISDVLFDWANTNSALLSAQRLKNLQKDYPEEIRERVANFVQRIPVLSKLPRWKSVAGIQKASETHNFPVISRASRPMLMLPGNLMLRFRTAMGVGVKADVLSVVLGNSRPVAIRYVAECLSYTPVGVRNSLDDLAASGFITETRAQPISYFAAVDKWKNFLDLDVLPRWTPWHHWFAFVIELINWVDTQSNKSIGSYATDVKVRKLVTHHHQFLQLAAHELNADAFQTDVGSSASVLSALVDWAERQLSSPPPPPNFQR